MLKIQTILHSTIHFKILKKFFISEITVLKKVEQLTLKH